MFALLCDGSVHQNRRLHCWPGKWRSPSWIVCIVTRICNQIILQFSFENAAIYIIAVGALSLGVGILCLQIFYLMAQSIIPGYYITSKYYIVQAYFVITRIHVLLFDALGNNGYLLCVPPISAFATSLCKSLCTCVSLYRLITSTHRFTLLSVDSLLTTTIVSCKGYFHKASS